MIDRTLIHPTRLEAEAADHLRRMLEHPWDVQHRTDVRIWLARYDATVDPRVRGETRFDRSVT